MSERIVGVGALLKRINLLFSQELPLTGIWVQGEVSGLTRHYTGHYYFTLKDGQGQIACAMWRSNVARLHFQLEEGMKIQVAGNVTVYEKSGRMQLIAREIRVEGIGALYQEFEARRQRLAAAGLFAPEHKKPRPKYIEDIAIVTGKEAAALQDVLSVVRKRWPMARLHLYPALVQGTSAPESIIKALKKADAGHHDAIILARGGGSFEDLFCFSDENLVKTIHDLHTFVVTGIGHEIDYTLSDYAADVRCVTPTAAAQFVTWDQQEIWRQLALWQQQMENRVRQHLDVSWQWLSAIQNHPWLKNPASWLEGYSVRLLNLEQQLEKAARASFSVREKLVPLKMSLVQGLQTRLHGQSLRLEKASSQLQAADPARLISQERFRLESLEGQLRESMTRRLAAASAAYETLYASFAASGPEAILAKGYAVIEQEGRPLAFEALEPGLQVEIVMHEGTARAAITGKETQSNGQQ